jgi:regulator of RNase E activity RraA
VDGEDRVVGALVDMGCYETVYTVTNVNKTRWYTTIDGAIDDANDGNEIIVYPATYYEGIDFDGKAITVRGMDPNDWETVAQTIIDANSGSRAVYFHNSEDANSVLRGLTVTGGTNGVECAACSPTIERCVIEENSSQGVYVAGSGAPLIQYNHVRGNTSFGVRLLVSGGKVKNNWIYDNPSYGLYCGVTTSVVIRNNTIVGNTTGIFNLGLSPSISNCIVWGNGTELQGCTVTYSCVEGGAAGTGNISSDPCFVDADSNDFHIAVDSPCIDASQANSTDTGELDIDAHPRLADGDSNDTFIVDMGADEYMGAYNVDVNLGYLTIQDAIDDANDGNTIVVIEGTYYENIDFNGTAVTVRSTDPNDWQVVEATIINGNDSGSVVTFDSNEDANSILMGFTLTDGNATYGGGIYCSGTSPTISNCLLTGNEAFAGAGMNCNDASPTVRNCIFSGNAAVAYGGAIDNYGGADPNIIDCLFTDNQATTWGEGGAIDNDNSSPTIVNCTFSRNWAYRGGGINSYGSSAKPKITNCIVWGNSASISHDEVYNSYSADPNFRHCDVNGCGGSWYWDPNFGTDGGNNLDYEPNFVDPNDPNGSDDLWGTSDDGLALNTFGIGTGMGDNDAIGQDILKDIKGDDRLVWRRVDLGPYETQPPRGD